MLSFLKHQWISRFISHYCSFILFVFIGLEGYGELAAQQIEIVDFLNVDATITPIPADKKVLGDVKYSFKILQQTDSIFLDAKNINLVDKVWKDGVISATADKIWLVSNFKVDHVYTAHFSYETVPKQTLYFFEDEIWTQGQGKYTSHWLPSLDDTNDKIEFDLTIVAPQALTVIANGKLQKIQNQQNLNHWQFDMQNPMASYLVAFAIGNFDKKEITSKTGVSLEMYYKPEDSVKVEPTYRYSKKIFDFLETEIGVPYPWQNYKQVPVRDFLYAGMENTSATFFSQAFMVDSIGFNDRNYVNVNAHELAHQWFGNMVTAKSNQDHWLQEGFATYFALLAEKEIFGEEYYYWQLYQTAEQLKVLSDEGKGESVLDPKASSLTFYQKGAWALHILKEKIGEQPFKTAVKNYLQKYKFDLVTTTNFLNELNAVSDIDLTTFEAKWLQQSAFQSEEAYQSLMKSNFIKKYFEISALRAIPLKDKKAQLRAALTFPNDFIGQEAVYQLIEEPISETLPLYQQAFNSNNLYVRQAVALSLQTIPKQLQATYESLLKDESYVTQEGALYQIWTQFPDNRAKYLDETEGIEGFQNKNVRQLWLALALITENYHDTKKPIYLKELKHYSSPVYSFEIRETSFRYINDLQLWDLETLKNLLEACVHPTWRFAKFSKELMNNVILNNQLKEQLLSLENQVSEKANSYLISITNL